MILKHLSVNDGYWRKTAFCYCKSKSLADEIVQEMYIKLLDYNVDVECLTKAYVSKVIFNIFKDYVKKISYDVNIDDLKKGLKDDVFEYNDYEKEITDSLSDNDKEWLIKNYDNSACTIGKEVGLSTKSVCYKLNSIRKEVLGVDYDLYKNKRLKYNNKK